MVVLLIYSMHFCGQLTSTSHTYKLISIYDYQAIIKKRKTNVQKTLPGTSASEAGPLTNRLQVSRIHYVASGVKNFSIITNYKA